ncbi:hypothetical protein DASB73_005620 [Starmerella bacillaris]|uniref:Rrn9 domain-containing protein n=1 Tax=Starmerella bacillaris TaxID=1247836 RepID=A0AAV5RDP1_STABA|nr:hypothetical protein DASB73_005620 [Starmerella bacillaris]
MSNDGSIDEFKDVISMLDNEQHGDLSAHLYAAYLLTNEYKFADGPVPHKKWTAWPMKDAPLPKIPFDFVNDKIRQGDRNPHQIEDNPSKVLLRAAEAFLQKTIHRKLYAQNLVPSTESPQLGALGQRILRIVDKYAKPASPAQLTPIKGLNDWVKMGLEGPAFERAKRLFTPRVAADLDYARNEYKKQPDSETSSSDESLVEITPAKSNSNTMNSEPVSQPQESKTSSASSTSSTNSIDDDSEADTEHETNPTPVSAASQSKHKPENGESSTGSKRTNQSAIANSKRLKLDIKHEDNIPTTNSKPSTSSNSSSSSSSSTSSDSSSNSNSSPSSSSNSSSSSSSDSDTT